MKIFLVQSASDLTGRSGYGKGILDGGHGHVLVSFADTAFGRRSTIFPDMTLPGADKKYDPPVAMKKRKVSK